VLVRDFNEECAMPDAATHPTAQELAAFSLGMLPERVAVGIAGHLQTCPSCRQAIEKMAPDSFLGKVRAAKPGTSKLPDWLELAGDTSSSLPSNAPSPAIPLDLPPVLANYNKYHFVRELGRGGMGVVYQAEQTVMGRTVAVKVINPSVLAHPEALPRFQAEVRAAARLDHPNIVRAYDAEQVGDLHLLVMEFVEGKSLAEVVQQKGPLPIPHACHYIRQAALGLQHAFEQGMVHRDIKPQNLMVNARGQVKVLDFGLARLRSERKQGGGLTQADAFMGTPEYISPEQATDARSADTRADIYSLGCTLYYLLTSHPPFEEETTVKVILAQIEKEAPPLHVVRSDVPEELSAVVARMLAKDPTQRFQQPIEVAQALAAFVKAGRKRDTETGSPAPSGVPSPGSGTVIAADIRKLKAILHQPSRESTAKEAPIEDEGASPFENLRDALGPPSEEKPTQKAAKGSLGWYHRWPVFAGIGAVVMALGLGACLMAGIVLKAKVRTSDGEAFVVLEVDQPDAEVLVDGGRFRVNIPGDRKPVEIKVEPGQHKLRISKEGFEAVTKEIELKVGESAPIRVWLEPVKTPQQEPMTKAHEKGKPAALTGKGDASFAKKGTAESSKVDNRDVGSIDLTTLEQKHGVVATFENGDLVLKCEKTFDRPMVVTRETYRPPFTVRMTIKTDSTDIRLWYANGGVILSWGDSKSELRVRDFATGLVKGIKGVGYIRENVFHDISFDVQPESMSLVVDQEKRIRIPGRYGHLLSTFGVGPAHGSTVTVKSIDIYN
jgi:serine/threonine protein kinase